MAAWTEFHEAASQVQYHREVVSFQRSQMAVVLGVIIIGGTKLEKHSAYSVVSVIWLIKFILRSGRALVDMYKCIFKRLIDLILSTIGIIVLIPVWIILIIAIKIDDPGPVFFCQKRIGKDKRGVDGRSEKQFFQIFKYRSMKMSTPHDVPTHKLENPEQYITKVGGFLRKTSLDELPQIFNIWLGQMSIIGPRPALWNQDDLYAERAKYGANAVSPGLTGWAQINGRDELEIDVKARLDGEYVQNMGFFFDCKCFFGTALSVIKQDGVMEGGTGTIEGRKKCIK